LDDGDIRYFKIGLGKRFADIVEGLAANDRRLPTVWQKWRYLLYSWNLLALLAA